MSKTNDNVVISRSFIDELLSRVNIVEIIKNRIRLRRSGSNFVACCPFHDEKTPSFTVSPNKQFYYCFGCGARGDAINFLIQYDKLHFVDAVKSLASQVGLELPNEVNDPELKIKAIENKNSYDVLSKVCSFYQSCLDKSSSAKKYLASRGISDEICSKFSVGYAPPIRGLLVSKLGPSKNILELLVKNGLFNKSEQSTLYERFFGRITFPIRDERGMVIAFGGRSIEGEMPKYLNSPETQLFHKGNELYGLFEAKRAIGNIDKILVVEGYIDVIALSQYGIDFSVATMGTAVTSYQINKIFRTASKVIFCFDGDKAGKTAAWRALEIALPLIRDDISVNFLLLPEGEDPDSYVRKIGQTEFLNQIDRSISISDFFFESFTSQVDINTIEGKSSMASKAYDFINRIPHGIYQELLLQRLSKIVQIDIQKLKNKNFVIEAENKTFVQSRKRDTNRLSIVEKAVSLLLSCPELANEVSAEDLLYIEKSDFQFTELLIWLIQLLKDEPATNVMSIIERCSDADSAELLASLSVRPLLIPLNGTKDEFFGTIKNLRKHIDDCHIEVLLKKSGGVGLSLEEKCILKELISKSKS